jgi:hypothetical protein
VISSSFICVLICEILICAFELFVRLKYGGQSGLWQHSQVCIPVTPSLVIEPTTVEEPVTNDSIDLETFLNTLKKINERVEGLSNGTR